MLTAKQEKFVQNLVKGMSQREAYKNSYDAKNMKDEVIDNKASDLFKKGEIRVRYEELLDKSMDEAIMTAKERKKWLTDVVKGAITNVTHDSNGNEYENEPYISDKLKAIDILNKMSGEYTTKIEGDISVKKLEDIL